MAVRVRFAPNSMGQVRIGNIRTAIYNWLFARHEGGEFLLRIADADQDKTAPDAAQAIFDALKWLNIDYDSEPVYQSTRTQAYLAAAEELMERGWAYKSDKGSTGQGESIIFAMPKDEISFFDEVRGELRKEAKDLTDFVIVRSNGAPVSHLANAVDNIEMGITHIIRGEDHIEETYRDVALFMAFGADVPVYAHLPLMVNHQGKPYSTRDGAAFISEFKEKGYLPEALFNYLALLGWASGDGRELLTREEMIASFDLTCITAAPVKMDMTKFEWMNGEYLHKLPRKDFAAGIKTALQKSGMWSNDISDEYLDKVAGLMQERTKTYAEITYFSGFFFKEDFHYDEMAVRNRLKKEGVGDLLKALKEKFSALDDFTAAKAQEALHAAAVSREAQDSQLVYPLRVAVSGLLMGPDLMKMLEVLGKERVISRIDRTLQIV
jgi:glutamyl-tRNA synthetase